MSPCFETILVVDGVPQHVEYHVGRIGRTLMECGCGMRDMAGAVAEALSKVCGSATQERCRLEYDGTGILGVYCQPYRRTLPCAIVPVEGSSIAYCCKWCDRSELDALRRHAIQRGGDEALIIRNGLVTDTTIANVAFWDGTRWLTPEMPLLCGTTRQRLLESGGVVATEIRVSDISRFSAVALMNALVGFAPLDISTWQRLQESSVSWGRHGNDLF
ncbi:aminotransferase class IV [Chrysiogenes arsenatis]|uniref:aminotransferase class IV n=1 Tax=Chrysiogenes arsenatis TaxID=309797 RepID=UPI000687BD29|nr:aminotransferase class IV [Chrysiogenes arsenatis]